MAGTLHTKTIEYRKSKSGGQPKYWMKYSGDFDKAVIMKTLMTNQDRLFPGYTVDWVVNSTMQPGYVVIQVKEKNV